MTSHVSIDIGQLTRPITGIRCQKRSGRAEIYQDAQRTHHNRGDGDGFADDHDLVHLFVIVEIGGNHHHDSAGRQADTEREVGDVQPPTDVVGHVGDDHAVGHLMSPCVRADERDRGQDDHPEIETQSAIGGLAEPPPEESEDSCVSHAMWSSGVFGGEWLGRSLQSDMGHER